MSETVASQIQFRAPSLAAPLPDVERLREQVTDFEELVEAMLERNAWLERELKRTADERDRLKKENERLRGE